MPLFQSLKGFLIFLLTPAPILPTRVGSASSFIPTGGNLTWVETASEISLILVGKGTGEFQA